MSSQSDRVRRGLSEFMTVPLLMILASAGLAVLAHVLEHAAGLSGLRGWLMGGLLASGSQRSALLGTLASGLLTVTSITFSLLIIAVQQSASTLTQVVLDQYIRRTSNQVFFGFFAGASVYMLLSIALARADPVIPVSVALLLALVALISLIALLYSTLNQMRPEVIVEAVHDHALAAEKHQSRLLSPTCREPRAPGRHHLAVCTEQHGFVTDVDVAGLRAALADHPTTEIVLRVTVGDGVTWGHVLADVTGSTAVDQRELERAVRHAVHLDRVRDVDRDPAYAVAELVNIAWTSGSSSKQNLEPAMLCATALRDLLARWSRWDLPERPSSPIVYAYDPLEAVFRAFESLTVVASESRQTRTMAVTLDALTEVLPRLSVPQLQRAELVARRALTVLDALAPVAELDVALAHLARALDQAGRQMAAEAVRDGRERLASRLGEVEFSKRGA